MKNKKFTFLLIQLLIMLVPTLSFCEEKQTIKFKEVKIINSLGGNAFLSFSPNGNSLIFLDGQHIKFLDGETFVENRASLTLKKKYLYDDVISISLSPDGKYVAVGTDYYIKIFSIEEFKEIKHLHVTGELFTYSGNGKYLIEADCVMRKTIPLIGLYDREQCEVRIFDSQNFKRRVIKAKVRVTSLTVSSDDKKLAFGQITGEVQILDLDNFKTYRKFIAGNIRSSIAAAFSPDNNVLATVEDYPPAIKIWDVNKSQEIRKLNKTTIAL